MSLDLAAVLDSPVGPTTKGLPGDTPPLRLRDVGAQGWNVLDGDLPLPLMVLRRSALEHNLATMADWCSRRGALFAPHGKTTMAPQLFERQLALGAWAITVASAQQAQVARAVGVSRVVVANQLVDAAGVRWLAGELRRDPSFELVSWVDSPASVEVLVEAGAAAGLDRPWDVVLEVGWAGGRTGARDDAAVDATVAAVRASGGRVRLVGVSLFEGLLSMSGTAATAATAGGAVATLTIEQLLDRGARTAERLHAAGDLDDGYLLTGGGSFAFDLVAGRFASAAGSPRVVLRAGCYVTHDHGMNDALSPLGSGQPRLAPGDVALQPALELWSAVHSTPEPGRAFLTLGRRDAPYDAGLPVPLVRVPRGSRERVPLEGARVTGLNDQHCFVEHDGRLEVGDRVVLGVSHPCTAFDKWQLLPVVDERWDVVDAVRTYF